MHYFVQVFTVERTVSTVATVPNVPSTLPYQGTVTVAKPIFTVALYIQI